MSDGLAAINLGFALDTLGSDLIGPGEEHDDRKAQGDHQHDGLDDPVGRADVLQDQVSYLDQQPTGHDVAHGYPKNITTFEFVE